MIFHDRSDAGRVLASHLLEYADRPDVLVLALPRGGVPVAFEVARELRSPLDVFIVRKLGVPGQEELAFGALASGGVRVLNPGILHELGISEETVDDISRRELVEIERRQREYRSDLRPTQVAGRTVILIDDGLATGSTMRAAVRALREMDPARIVVAVPVASAFTCNSLQSEADEVICVSTPQDFYAVGQWYREFDQTTDQEVRELLERSNRPTQRSA